MKKLSLWMGTLALMSSATSTFGAMTFETFESRLVTKTYTMKKHVWYVAPHIGANKMEQFDFAFGISNPLPPVLIPPNFPDCTVKLDLGFLGGLSYGYRFENVRLENELTLRSNTVAKVKDVPTALEELPIPIDLENYPEGRAPEFLQAFTVKDEGRVASVAVMFNIYYEWFNQGLQMAPFIGVGIGLNVAQYSSDLRRNYSRPFAIGSQGPDISERFISIALQAMVGLNYVLSEHVEVDAMFKMFTSGNENSTIEQTVFGVPDGADGRAQTYDYSVKYNAMSLSLEVRFL